MHYPHKTSKRKRIRKSGFRRRMKTSKGRRSVNRQRRLGRNGLGNPDTYGQHLPAGHPLLHKLQSKGLGTAKLLAGQQMQQGVAQPCALGHAQGGTAGGHDAAFDFQL